VEVHADTKMITGVVATVVRDRVYLDGAQVGSVREMTLQGGNEMVELITVSDQ